MKERKYKESYRLTARTDPRTGRERRVAEYTGARQRFPAGTPGAKARARRLAVPLALYWAGALAYLKTAGVTGRYMLALPPFLLGLFPGAYALMGLASLLRAPDEITVTQREKGLGRLVRSALGCGIFSALATTGAVVCLSRARAWAGAWHEQALTLLCAICGFTAFALARSDFRALETIQQPGTGGREDPE